MTTPNDALTRREALRRTALRVGGTLAASTIAGSERAAWTAPPGLRAIHEMGTARMGRDPRTSALREWNQPHDVPNLFVTDGACMTSSSCVNPSITCMALTARACDHAVREMKARRLQVDRREFLRLGGAAGEQSRQPRRSRPAATAGLTHRFTVRSLMPNIRVPNVAQASLSRTAIALLLAGAAALVGCKTTPSQMRPALSDGTASQAPNQLSEAERAAGWRLLFDGRTLAGWRGLGYKTVLTAHWAVESGAIKKIASGKVPVQADGQPSEGGDLMTEATYRDFELAWDWKMTPAGNSGVKYNVSEELSMGMAPSHAAKGFEYQMIDDVRHSDGKLPTHRTGALYDLIAPPDDKPMKPVGAWNHSVLIVDGSHGEHWLNGRKVVEYELGSPAMNAALAKSKYAPISWFAARRAGHIVLQDHGDEVYFRNLKIRELHVGH